MIQENQITWLEVHYWYWKLKHSRRVDVSATQALMNRKKKNKSLESFSCISRKSDKMRYQEYLVLSCRSVNAIVAQPKNCHLGLILWLSSKIQKLNLTIPAASEFFQTKNCVGFVGCSCYICFLNHRINTKWLFLSCIQWVIFVTEFLVVYVSHARYAYVLSGPYKDMLKCLVHKTSFVVI